MTTFLSFEYAHRSELPEGDTDEVRTPDALVEHFLQKYTEPGDNVIDIFAGFGTTLMATERLNRIPFGLEYETDRVSYIKNQITASNHIRQGDVLDLESSWFPMCECCFTSPPFMTQTMERNPFLNYSGRGSYDNYLNDIETAFTRLDSVIAPGGYVLVDVVNMKYEGRVTPLAWDIAEHISNIFQFNGEVVITWEDNGNSDNREGRYGYGYDHSYCHVFSKPDE